LIFLSSASYLREDHIAIFVQTALDCQPTFLKYLH
jgi:hypothetical protein